MTDENTNQTPQYATPYNVDLFFSNSKNYFAEYIRRVFLLPESIRNILTDDSTAEFIEDKLGANFNLSPQNKIEITRIIRDVLLGDLSLNTVSDSISVKLNINEDTAAQITNKIVIELFQPAIEDIKKMQKEKFSNQSGGIARNPEPIQSLKKTPVSNSSVNPNNVVDLRNNRNNQ